jgi:hypothetical protein
MNASDIVEIPGFLQNEIVKTYIFSSEGINVESVGPAVFIPAEHITAFRYRTVWLRGYSFAFGRQYILETKDFNDKVFQIKFTSIYGIRRKTYYGAWCDIFEHLWKHYFSNTLCYYTDLYSIRQMFELAGVNFDTDGISWDKKNKLLWKEIALKNYRSYFMIHNINNPLQHKSCSFANDWNAFILQCLLKAIIKEHKNTLQVQ